MFYNGPDENSAVLYQGTNGGSFTGFALNSQNAANTITMRIQSDGSGSCGDGAAGATELWWHVGCGAVGIEETASTGFTMFPNPTNGSLTINIGASVQNSAYVNVIDMQGRTVAEQRINQKAGSTNILDLSGLSAGQYMVKVITDEWVRTQALQIAR